MLSAEHSSFQKIPMYQIELSACSLIVYMIISNSSPLPSKLMVIEREYHSKAPKKGEEKVQKEKVCL